MIERIVIGAVCFVLAAAGAWWALADRYDDGFEAGQLELRSNYDREYARATDALRADHDRQVQAMRKSREADVKRTATRLAAADAARSELDRLRDEVSGADRRATSADPADRPGVAEAAAYRRVFAACAGEYLRVAGAAAALKDQVIGLLGATAPTRIGGDSPAGERPRAGIVDLVTQPATAPVP